MSDSIFGYSLALIDGDIVIAGAQVVMIAGLPNLAQALQLRVLTPFGSDPINVTYGLDVRDAFTEPGNLRMVKDLIRLNLVRTIGTDPRVRDIRSILFQDEPEYLAQHPELSADMVRDARRRRAWQVEVIIETIDGTQATVPLVIAL